MIILVCVVVSRLPVIFRVKVSCVSRCLYCMTNTAWVVETSVTVTEVLFRTTRINLGFRETAHLPLP